MLIASTRTRWYLQWTKECVTSLFINYYLYKSHCSCTYTILPVNFSRNLQGNDRFTGFSLRRQILKLPVDAWLLSNIPHRFTNFEYNNLPHTTIMRTLVFLSHCTFYCISLLTNLTFSWRWYSSLRKNSNRSVTMFSLLCLFFYRGADKSLARHTCWCILFDSENISSDASLVIYK
jgi:hypothetical protein